MKQQTISSILGPRLIAIAINLLLLAALTPSAMAEGASQMSEAEATEFQPMSGGSSDILQIKSQDATVVGPSDAAFIEIRIEPSVYDQLWYGVLDGTYQYILIDSCRFFVDYNPRSRVLFAYDWLGFRYLISRKGS
jgi:hypothetical protein